MNGDFLGTRRLGTFRDFVPSAALGFGDRGAVLAVATNRAADDMNVQTYAILRVKEEGEEHFVRQLSTLRPEIFARALDDVPAVRVAIRLLQTHVAVLPPACALSRTRSFHPGRTKWHVYPFGMRSR